MSKNKRTYPIETLWHGHVQAQGLFFPSSEPYCSNLRKRLMCWWQADVRVYVAPLGVLLIFSQPLGVQCEFLDGWPLCSQGKGLASLPLPKKRSDALDEQDIVILMQGQLHIFSLRHAKLISLADWVCLDEWQLAEIEKPRETEVTPVYTPAISTVGNLADVFSVGPAPQSLEEIEQVPSRRYACGKGVFISLWGEKLAQTWRLWKDSRRVAKKERKQSEYQERVFKQKASHFAPEENPKTSSSSLKSIFWWGVGIWFVVRLFSKASTGGLGSVVPLLIFFAIAFLVGLIWGLLRSWFSSVTSHHRYGHFEANNGIAQPSKWGAASWFQRFKNQVKSFFWGEDTKKEDSSSQNQAVSHRKPMNDAIMRSMLGKFLQRRQAKYMRRMIKMFENQDYANALRYAIPLSQNEINTSSNSALSIPDPRQQIQMSLARSTGGSSIYTAYDVQQYLRDIYRRSFERLDRQGNIDHAAFVLVELLGDIAEAVNYLEKHGRLEQAAQVAEAKGHDPAMAIRLWLKLGKLKQAMQWARMNDAFSTTIRMLEHKGESEHANILRYEYAFLLESKGDYEAAIRQLAPMVQKPEFHGHDLMKHLIASGLQRGDLVAARTLAKQVLWYPQEEDAILDAYNKLLNSDDDACPLRRKEFAQELSESKNTHKIDLSPLANRLLQHTLRHLLQDRQTISGPPISRGNVNTWFSSLDRSAFVEDKTKIKAIQETHASREKPVYPIELSINFSQGLSVHDVGFALGNSGYVLALGEAGVDVIRVDSQGKRIARHFNCVAHRIIVSDNGMRAIVLSDLGASYYVNTPGSRRYQVHVLELDTGKSRIYGVLDLVEFASTYSGVHWLTWNGSQLQIFDMLLPKPTIIWSVGEFEGKQFAGVRRQNSEDFYVLFQLLGSPDKEYRPYAANHINPFEFELWRYSGNGTRLVERRTHYAKYLGGKLSLFLGNYHATLFTLRDDDAIIGDFQYLMMSQDEFKLYPYEIMSAEERQLKEPRSWNLALIQPYLLEIISTDQDSVFKIYSDWMSVKKEKLVEISFSNAKHLNWRIIDAVEGKLLLWDDLGRVVVMPKIDSQIQNQLIKFSA